jgi:hypothetical protein
MMLVRLAVLGFSLPEHDDTLSNRYTKPLGIFSKLIVV